MSLSFVTEKKNSLILDSTIPEDELDAERPML